MRINEVITERTRQVIDVQPATVDSQQRITGIVNQLAAADQKPKPTTDDEKAMAFAQFSNIKRQAATNYAKRLRQQLANVEAKGAA
jgi:hypothetical protein